MEEDSAGAGLSSMDAEFARKLIIHCCWEDERVWQLAIAPLSDAQFTRAVEFGLGSIQSECVYIMNIERQCLMRLRGKPQSPALDHGFDRELMREHWREIHHAWHGMMDELDAELLMSDCVIAGDNSGATLKAWQLLFDLVYQGTTHRADIMRMVAEVHEPPAFDLSLMQFLSGVYRQ
jgi:uncharacterized damage-inducible protein DinB